MYTSRRKFLKWSALLTGSSAACAASIDGLYSGQSRSGRIVLVLLRGAYDGLSAFYPYSDSNYLKYRPNISLGKPEENEESPPYRLDEDFALHPSLSLLIPFWEKKQFAFIPTAGLSKVNRSHFEAQHFLETGQEDNRSAGNGWLNNLACLDPGTQLLGVGEANPEILRGQVAPKLVPRGNAALQTGVLGDPHQREVLERLYANDSNLSEIFLNGENSRINTAMMLNQAQNRSAQEMMQANKDASAPSALLQDCRHLISLMEQSPQFKLGFLSAGGWDTHAGQGNEKGVLANNFYNLAKSLTFLQTHLNQPDDVIVVMSEFGRTVHENASRGTDHGYGNAMMIMGPRINGGKRLGRWEGLSSDRLNDSRDLPVFHDYRSVVSQICREIFKLDSNELAKIFPNFLPANNHSYQDLKLFI